MVAFAVPTVAQPLVSPEVHSDSRITFRLKAPNAREVTIRLETVGSKPMQKDERGIWSFTSEPMQPDIYSYAFIVDGVQMIDPANPLLKYNLLNTAATDSQLRLSWIDWGRQDGLIGVNKKLVEWLKSKGVMLTWVEIPGRHSFLVWRHYLVDLVSQLLQEKP